MHTDYKEILNIVLDQYQLPAFGRHGISHWARVWEGGIRVAKASGGDLHIVKLFALFHDSKRQNEAFDPGHGLRGTDFAKSLRGKALDISDSDFDLLYYACSHHTDGMTDADVTVRACWDADRLDLGRIGVRPDPKFLCTDAAKDEEMIQWSFDRGRNFFKPKMIESEWDIQADD